MSIIFSFGMVRNFKWKIHKNYRQFNFYVFSICYMSIAFPDFINGLYAKFGKNG